VRAKECPIAAKTLVEARRHLAGIGLGEHISPYAGRAVLSLSTRRGDRNRCRRKVGPPPGRRILPQTTFRLGAAPTRSKFSICSRKVKRDKGTSDRLVPDRVSSPQSVATPTLAATMAMEGDSASW